MDEALLVVGILGMGIAAGGMLVVLVAIIPTRLALPPDRGLELHQRTTPPIDTLVPPAAIGGVIAGALLVGFGDLTTGATVATIAGLVAAVAVSVLSAGFNRPTNRRVAEWREAPPEYESVFARWNSIHRVRTGFATIAFAAYALAAVLD